MSVTQTQQSRKNVVCIQQRNQAGWRRSQQSRSWRRFYIQHHAPVATTMRCGRTCIWVICEHYKCLSNSFYVSENCYTCVTRVSGSCLTTSSGSGSWVSPMSLMLRTGNSAVREMMTFMGPQWNTMESLPMTCQHLTFHLSFTLLLSSFTELWAQMVNSHTGSLRLDIETKHLSIHFLSFMPFRKGVCALCCRCKSLRCVGPGLPDDLSPSQPPVLCALSATETLDFSQQGLLETTYTTGPKTPRVKRVKSSNC